MRMKDFLKQGHHPTLLAAFFYFTVSFAVWMLLGVLGVFIAKDFHLTPTQKGFLAAIPILGGSLIRIPLGAWVDQMGAKKIGILAQFIVMLPLVGIWLSATSFPEILAWGFLLGVAGGSFAVALPLASRWYPPEHQGMALGIVGAGNSGTVLGSLFAPSLAELVGWRNVFGLALLPVVATLFAFILLAKESPHRPPPKKLIDYFSVLKESDTFWLCLFYGITFGGFVGLASFLGIFFYDQYGLSRVSAGHFTALCLFAGSFFRPVGGYLADRFGGARILTLLFGLIGTFMLGVALLPPLVLATGLIFLGITCLGMGNGSVFQLVPLRFQKEIGLMTGVVGAAGGLGGFLLPTFLGFVKETTGSYGLGFFAFAALSWGALGLLRKVQQRWAFERKALLEEALVS